jgi:nucleoside-diphosphate-sugar epimerase
LAKVAPRLLVIGGTGFIGRHLLHTTVNLGWDVTSVSLHPISSENLVEKVKYLQLNIICREECEVLLRHKFEYVVNLGGYIDHRSYSNGGRSLIETHFTALQNLVDVILRDDLRSFVQIGSSDEYGNAHAPQMENLRESPISPYSLGKVASTHFLQMLHRTEGFPSTILRLFLTYGPGQASQRFLPQIIKGCLEGKPFPTSTGEQFRDFCFVKDSVQAIVRTLQTPSVHGEVINIASGNPISIRTMIETVQELVEGGQPQFGKIPYRTHENMELYASVAKAKTMLGWNAETELKKGLKITIDSYKSPHG